MHDLCQPRTPDRL